MTHNLQSYWNGCRCPTCTYEFSEYRRKWRLGEKRLVSAKAARKVLMSFEDGHDAAKMLGLPTSTVWNIRSGHHKRIRRSTEQKILRAA